LPGVTYLRGDGVTAVPGAALVAIGVNNCAAVVAASKAVSFASTAAVIFGATDLFFELNLPDFVYNLAEINAGDIVSVRVTLSQATCGSVTFDLCMGTFGCGAAPLGAGTLRFCPYVTSLAAGDDYWNGSAIVNTGAVTGTVAVTATKQDGTTATFTTPAIGPIASGNTMYVTLLGDVTTWVGTTPLGMPASLSVQAADGMTIDAFVMMADGGSNSMGYLCR
jgi:hypothetical protein